MNSEIKAKKPILVLLVGSMWVIIGIHSINLGLQTPIDNIVSPSKFINSLRAISQSQPFKVYEVLFGFIAIGSAIQFIRRRSIARTVLLIMSWFKLALNSFAVVTGFYAMWIIKSAVQPEGSPVPLFLFDIVNRLVISAFILAPFILSTIFLRGSAARKYVQPNEE